MKNTPPRITQVTLKEPNAEYLKREKHFIAEATSKPELQRFFQQDYSVNYKLASTPGFINHIIFSLESKQQEKHKLLVDKIKGIFLQQDQHTADTFDKLASDFMESTQTEKVRIEILKEIFKRANTSADRMVNVLLGINMEQSDVSLAKLEPKRYQLLQDEKMRKEFMDDTRRFCSDYVLLDFLIEFNKKLNEQTSLSSEKFKLNKRINELATQQNKYIPATVLQGTQEESVTKRARKESIINKHVPEAVLKEPSEESPTKTARKKSFFGLLNPRKKEDSPHSPQSQRNQTMFASSSPSGLFPKIDPRALVSAGKKLKKVEEIKGDEQWTKFLSK